MTPFLKMHGLGNDFVVFDARREPLSLDAAVVRAVADRRLGVGCDQVIVIEGAANGADASMRIFNADGGEVESCGNAARCVARLLMDETSRNAIRLETEGGALVCAAAEDVVSIDMGVPRVAWQEIPLSERQDTLSFPLKIAGFDLPALEQASAVNVGNPHCVLFVESVEQTPVDLLGPLIETNPLFPARTNVEFAQVLSPERLRLRVWERGVGVTRACGTGACAAMVAAHRRKLCGTRVEVVLDGGSLDIAWEGGESPLLMRGPAALSFRGEIDLVTLA